MRALQITSSNLSGFVFELLQLHSNCVRLRAAFASSDLSDERRERLSR